VRFRNPRQGSLGHASDRRRSAPRYVELWVVLAATVVFGVVYVVVGDGSATPVEVTEADAAAAQVPAAGHGPVSPTAAAEQLAGDSTTIPGASAEPSAGAGVVEVSLFDQVLAGDVALPMVEAPEQVGYLSELADTPFPGAPASEGGFDEAAPVVAVDSSVDDTSESVDTVGTDGRPATAPEQVGSSPVSVGFVAVESSQALTAGVVPEVEVEVLDSATSLAAGLGEIGFILSADDGSIDGLSARQVNAVGTFTGDVNARVSVDYSAFVDEHGADWARRLRVGRFERCTLSGAQGCGPRLSGEFVNDVAAGVLSFEVPLSELFDDALVEAAADAGVGASEAAGWRSPGQVGGGGGSGFALMAGASSAAGDYATTSLNPTGSWSVGTQSGGFTWSYPVGLPAPPAGSAPGLSVSYSSAAIDGLTSDQNTQGGVMGPGWSVAEGFIERQYRPCNSPDEGGAVADFCWAWDNATFSFGGMSDELVYVGPDGGAPAGWQGRIHRFASHSGWQITQYRRTNLPSDRGALGVDNDREHWVALAPDGTKYWFGYGREAGTFNPGTVLGSVQTVPVVGNHSGEPCNALSNNWCHQAYRWSLDRIEDSNGRVISFNYLQETNYYGVKGSPSWSEPYVAAAVLEKIEYGQLAANAEIADIHTHEVGFGYQWRCNDPVDGVCSGQPTSSNGSRYPDIPVDQFCGDTYCTNYAPTFFHQRMMVSITSRTRNAAGAIANVAQEMFFYRWVEADGPDSDRLWLDRIQHRGLAGGDSTMPSIRFGVSSAMANRVDYNIAGGVPEMKYFRVGEILDEYGSELRVAYTRTRVCTAADLPAWQNNTWSCYARWWTPPSGPSGFAGWHRWVVDYVHVIDQSGDIQSTTKVIDYAYPQANGTTTGGMAWHSDTTTLAPVATRSWGEYRGFEVVDVTVGHAAETNRTVTRYFFHQGMDDDINSHSNPNGVARDNETTPSTVLGTVVDADWLAGREREVSVLNFERSALYSRAVTDYTAWATAAVSTTHGEGPSYQVEASMTRSMSSYGGATRYGRVDFVFDTTHAWMHRLIQVRDYGEVDSTYANIGGDDGNPDERCSLTSYTPASSRFVNGVVHRSALYTALTCTSGMLTETRTYFDQTGVTAVASPPAPTAPTSGRISAVWKPTGGGVENDAFTAVPAIVETSTYEPNGYAGSASWGRPATLTDARGDDTSFAYTVHGTASLGTKTVTTQNQLGHTTTVEYDIYGRVRRSEDENGRDRYVCYDMFGRVTKVYDAGVAGGSTCTASPSITYAYPYTFENVNTAGGWPQAPRWAVQTRVLFALDADPFNAIGTGGDQYLESWSLFDGFGRVAQTNSPSPIGGRMVERTRYDTHDNPIYQSEPFQTTAITAGSQWAQHSYAQIPIDTRTTYDSIDRPLLVETLDNNVAIREQPFSYSAERVVEYAPTATGSPSYGLNIRYFDAYGNVITVAEYQNTTGNTNTTYQYDRLDRLVGISDAAGVQTSMAYNQLGWRTVLNDPNAGRSTTNYNQTGQISRTTDANQTQLTYRYDHIGRLVDVFNNTAMQNGQRWAHYVYDTATGGIGALDYVHSYDPTSATPAAVQTRTETVAFDTAGRPTIQNVTMYAANDPAVTGDEALAATYAFTTSYTRNGAVYQQSYPGVAGSNLTGTETVVHTYNTLGMLTQTADAADPDTFWYLYSVGFDGVGRPRKTILGGPDRADGMILNTLYAQSDGRLERLEALIGTADADGTTVMSEVLQRDTYTYDAPGNPTQVMHNTRWDAEMECFDYDGRQRLVEAYTLSYPTACPDPSAAHGTGGPVPYTDTFAIDNIGRITNFDGAARTHGESASGCMAGTQAIKPHALSTHGTETFNYDCNGAITQHTTSTGSTSFAWDEQQRLATVTSSAAGVTRSAYDATNNRVLRVDPDGTKTVYLGGTEIRYTPGSGVTVARTYGQVRREFDGTRTYMAVNHQGSITATTNTASAHTQTRYTPYGTPRPGYTGSITDVDDRNFLGQVDDPATATVYLNNRHYLPGIGVFTSTDPIARPTNPATLNPYVYSRANPVSMTDVSGLEPRCSQYASSCAEANRRYGRRNSGRASGHGGSSGFGSAGGTGGPCTPHRTDDGCLPVAEAIHIGFLQPLDAPEYMQGVSHEEYVLQYGSLTYVSQITEDQSLLEEIMLANEDWLPIGVWEETIIEIYWVEDATITRSRYSGSFDPNERELIDSYEASFEGFVVIASLESGGHFDIPIPLPDGVEEPSDDPMLPSPEVEFTGSWYQGAGLYPVEMSEWTMASPSMPSMSAEVMVFTWSDYLIVPTIFDDED
jgi:RHS repeat-associated protein